MSRQLDVSQESNYRRAKELPRIVKGDNEMVEGNIKTDTDRLENLLGLVKGAQNAEPTAKPR